MPDHDHDHERRRFLLRTSAAALAAGASGSLASACGPTMMMMQGPQDAGLATCEIGVGTVVFSSTLNLYIGHDSGGFYAYSSVCTHEGCTVPIPTPATPAGFSMCPCHNSRFNGNGDVQPGSMALRSLEHYRVTFTGTGCTARVLVDQSVVVTDRAARAVAP